MDAESAFSIGVIAFAWHIYIRAQNPVFACDREFGGETKGKRDG